MPPMRLMNGGDVGDALWGCQKLLPSVEDREDPLCFVQGANDTQG